MAHPQRLMPLEAEQLQASDPKGNIWLSASAGTGKTHVLTARVLRLLLNRAAPESILCLTFTKAGAAEMSERINQRLAKWVIQLNDDELREELQALGARYDRDTLALARTLFARVLDAPGGLRIQTIHSFCQSLLTAFPVEAGLIPGFQLIEGREEATQAKKTLTRILDHQTPPYHIKDDDIALLAEKLGEQGAEDYIYQCRFHAFAFNNLGVAIESRVKRALDLPFSDINQALEEACDDDHFDFALLRQIAEANEKWDTATAHKNLAIIQDFVAASPADRLVSLGDFQSLVLTQKGELKKAPIGIAKKIAPEYEEWMIALSKAIHQIISLKKRHEFSQFAIAALRTGQAYSQAWQQTKKESGLVDFNDMIETSVALLRTPGIGEWVRYKLDRTTDHILVDEAQDTNIFQWAIISALAEDFFSGESAKSVEASRSIFAVGDFKQAIYGFQGTDPQAFIDARDYFNDKSQGSGREILDLSLNRSFRSTPPILAIVDQMLADIESSCGGIGINQQALQPHQSARSDLGGSVVLWQPISDYQEDGENTSEETDADDEEQLENGELELAIRLARQIEFWLNPKTPLYLPALGRNAAPRDILILVRNRGRLASLIVGCLHAQKIPVAGLDRLTLTAPLAVSDLLSAIRFVLQPDDDLTLACLLVSPLIGWDQERLYRLAAKRAKKESLFDRLRKSEAEKETWDIIREWLSKADFITPYRFLEMLLSGKGEGRRKLLERLGEEARDPINELLNAALLLESETTPSFQRFLDWFDSGDVEIKRDPSVRQNTVRIMTVHGAKGLQAPVVILADATRDPHQSNGFRKEIITWPLDEANAPIPMPSNDDIAYLPSDFGDIINEKKAKDLQEHWRLLYVAATRAEEYLVITGHLGSRAKNIPPKDSWYACATRAITAMGIAWQEDAMWQQKAVYHWEGRKKVTDIPKKQPTFPKEAMPSWIKNEIPEEPKPAYPLRPSDLVKDNTSNPPPDGGSITAAKRGTLLHALFERLPMLPVEEREKAGLRWLETSAGVKDAALRNSLIKDACDAMSNPVYRDIFSEKALAEAPIAAKVGEHVISGTVDRLWIDRDKKRVHIVDFKTGRRVPATKEQVSDAYQRQLAAYVVALEKIFPDYAIEASLLYTTAPKLVSFEQPFLHDYFVQMDKGDIQSENQI
ncbi:double-strand break repair helicase AddA [Zymomonas mobilis]|uniref:double-strand break repair helicase AddA n=1 Tax=Zymomonas mobilis TaxID=542 RepID=UPI0039EAC973